MNNNSFDNKPLSGINIAIVANTAWNIAHFRAPLARILQSHGANIVAFSPAGEEAAEIEEGGMKFVALRQLSRRSTNPIGDLKLIAELRRNFRQHNIDLSLHFTPKAAIYGSRAVKRLKIPAISTITGLGYAFIRKPLLRFIVTRLYRWALKHATLTVFQNEDDLNLFLSERMITKDQATVIRGSGVDTQFFSPNGEVNTRGSEHKDRCRFLFVGRLLIDKGIIEYLNAAKAHLQKHPNDEFHVVGGTDEGNPASLTPAVVEEWKKIPNIIFHGQTPDVKKYLVDCDVFVLPSYREGLPRVVLEAMSMAKPCVSTDVPGCRSTVVHEKTGLLVEARQSQGLVDAFEEMVTMPAEQRNQMGAQGRQRVLDIFSIDIICQQYLDLILKIVENSKVR